MFASLASLEADQTITVQLRIEGIDNLYSIDLDWAIALQLHEIDGIDNHRHRIYVTALPGILNLLGNSHNATHLFPRAAHSDPK